MKQYNVELQSEISKSFRCQKAADSLDIDVSKKSIHKLNIEADIDTDYSIGLIIGASGSGKTTLAKHLYGQDCFKEYLDVSKPVIDQFPTDFKYEQCAEILTGVGLTSVPCWIRPAYTLSNGQRTRAEVALAIAHKSDLTVIDEWTSVVDRTVAKVMSHCISKTIRKQKDRQVVLLSCHYDVIEFLNPDWIIDCNKQTFTDRRSLWRNFDRTEKLIFEVRETTGKEWKYFSKYHYLSDKLPVGKTYHFGLFCGDDQIGYLNFANYVPKRPNKKLIYHFNRLVIHPDYVGFGLGVKFLNEATIYLKSKVICDVFGAFSSVPVYKALLKDPKWKLKDIRRPLKKTTGSSSNKIFMRLMVTMFSFKHI
jgi:ABC-type ATPase with predicted acetyltransferase domain